jgi:dienelactone hydrolase
MGPSHTLASATLAVLATLSLTPQASASSAPLQGVGAAPPAGRAVAAPVNGLGGRVWQDADRDGLQESGEAGVADVIVRLLDAYGRTTGIQTLTSADGTYQFLHLDQGRYRVAFERPAGRGFTNSLVGSVGPGGATITPGTFSDDSDLNLANGAYEPTRRGPHATGMRYFELTRLDAQQAPWPVNVWVVYPAAEGQVLPYARVRDLYLGDVLDMTNHVATSKLATTATAGDPNDIGAADPGARAHDIEARVDAAPAPAGSFPVVLVCSGLLGSSADMVEIGDQLASHGYIALCMESTAFHASVALGSRLAAQGGPYLQSDFAHIPQASSADLAQLLTWGYQEQGYITGAWKGSVASFIGTIQADADLLLDTAEARNVHSGHPLAGKLDLRRVGWYGYSAGAGSASGAVNDDSRIAFLINADSALFVNVPKPMLWLGNHTSASTLGPSLQARLTGDFHPFYFSIPATTFDPPAAAGVYNREYHHDFRNAMITAFCGYYLKDALAYRDSLGIDGIRPNFDGYVTPYLVANQGGWHSTTVEVGPGAATRVEVGLVEAPLWILDANHLRSLTSDFLPVGDVVDSALINHGGLLESVGGSTLPLADATVGLAVSAEREAWFLAGNPPRLYCIDLATVVAGAPPLAQSLGVVAGLPSPVRSLSFEPRGARLLALAGPGPRLYGFSAASSPTAVDLGPLPSGVLAPVGLDVDLRGRTWAADGSTPALTRTTPGAAQALGSLAFAGTGAAALAYDEFSQRLLVVDAGGLLSVDPESGLTQVHGTLAAHGIGASAALAFERRLATRHETDLTGQPSASGAQPRPLLVSASVLEPAGGWDGRLLRVQISEGTGKPSSDALEIASTGNLSLGLTTEPSLAPLLIGQGRELLWNGTVIGWLETDWGLAVGGDRLAPLRIAFNGNATAAAVEDVLEALRYSGPLPRRFELLLVGVDGEPGLPHTVELSP